MGLGNFAMDHPGYDPYFFWNHPPPAHPQEVTLSINIFHLGALLFSLGALLPCSMGRDPLSMTIFFFDSRNARTSHYVLILRGIFNPVESENIAFVNCLLVQ